MVLGKISQQLLDDCCDIEMTLTHMFPIGLSVITLLIPSLGQKCVQYFWLMAK